LPERPSKRRLAIGSLRRNAAARASMTLRRASSESVVSPARVISLRKSSRSWSASASSCECRSTVGTFSTIVRCGSAAGSGNLRRDAERRHGEAGEGERDGGSERAGMSSGEACDVRRSVTPSDIQ
jgi:hypothetical protein